MNSGVLYMELNNETFTSHYHDDYINITEDATYVNSVSVRLRSFDEKTNASFVPQIKCIFPV